MKYTIVLILLLLTEVNIFAQKSVTGLVLYGHKQSLGLGAPVGIDYTASLAFNGYQSTYTCKKDSLEGGHVNEFVQSRNKDVISLSQKITNKRGFVYFHDRDKNLAKSRDIGFMYVKEEIPTINWKISKEIKNIGKFTCTKATGEFRGREYTAWFTTQIPVSFGPWKLQGLPGLILEAYDTNKEVYFYFKSIEYPYSKKLYIQIPNPKLENKQWITLDEFKKQTIKSFNKGVENFRMASEQNSISVIDNLKPLMKDAYLEVFNE